MYLFFVFYFHYILFSTGFSKSEGSAFPTDPNYDPLQGKRSFIYAHFSKL
jgi:hypothetical protein